MGHHVLMLAEIEGGAGTENSETHVDGQQVRRELMQLLAAGYIPLKRVQQVVRELVGQSRNQLTGIVDVGGTVADRDFVAVESKRSGRAVRNRLQRGEVSHL